MKSSSSVPQELLSYDFDDSFAAAVSAFTLCSIIEKFTLKNGDLEPMLKLTGTISFMVQEMCIVLQLNAREFSVED